VRTRIGLGIGLLLLVGVGASLPAAPAPEERVTSSVLLRSILQDLLLPPIGPGETGEHNKPWPTFSSSVMSKYASKVEPNQRLREAVRKAQVAIWAVSFTPVPRELEKEVRKVRAAMGFDESGLRTYLAAPIPGPAETAFKVRLTQQGKQLARAQSILEEIQDDLAELRELRDKAPLRWQATYDLMTARLALQQVALDEYQYAYGSMRKEMPDRKDGHNGWQLAPMGRLHGEMASKKMAQTAQKGLEEVMRANPGTLWAEMARRTKEVPLGLEWQSAP
jgi:hypothetical protein